MKKILTLSLLLSLAGFANAQNSNIGKIPQGPINFSRPETRSTGAYLYPQSIVTAANGGLGCSLINWYVDTSTSIPGNDGYIFGNNGFIAKEHAMSFNRSAYWEGSLLGTATVDTVFVAIPYKSVGATPGDITVKLYNGKNTQGPTGSVLGTSDPVNMVDIDTLNGISVFVFNPPVTVGDNFFASVVLSQNAGDTIRILATDDDCFQRDTCSWSKYNSWHSSVAYWGSAGNPLNCDLYMIASIVNEFGLSVNNNSDIRMMPSYPNPTADYLVLNYGLKQASEITISVYNVEGKLIQSSTEINQKGVYTKNVDVKDLANGIYMYVISTSNGKAFGKFSVSK